MQFTTTLTVEIPEDLGSFQEAELSVQGAMFESGKDLLIQILKSFEQKVANTKHFWIKDKRFRNIQTLIGELQFERYRVYDHKKKKSYCPLDEWLGLKSRESASPGLRSAIVRACTHRPYRQANDEICRWTGNKRRVMADWKLVQREAKEFEYKQPVPFDWCRSPLPSYPTNQENPCPVLGLDFDGTYCKARRKKYTDHDVKLAVLYSGKECSGGKKKKRYRLTNKNLVPSKTSESNKAFFNRVTQTAIENYGLNHETLVVLHGDGDQWIRTYKQDYGEKILYRLDPWHVKKKMREALGTIEVPKAWEELIYGKPDELALTINLFTVQHTAPHSEERQNLTDLANYIKNNREGLLPSGVDQETKKKYPRLFLRGSGQMESNIGTTICDRFKQRRMSWSSRGLDNLLMLRSNSLSYKPKIRYPVPVPKKRPKLWDGLHTYSPN